MCIPVDDMLSELRTVLEAFADDPSDFNFDRILTETRRIEATVENVLCDDEEE